FFNGTLTIVRCNDFLINELQTLLDDLPYATRFPGRWTGRGSRIPFPTKSPHISTPIDFFLWDFIKDKVYREEPITPDNMKNRIKDAFQQIISATLERVQLSFRDRVNQGINIRGHHFEYRR
ncbi:hypothetical protein WH47_02941, partial [Habropoda laboriosa]